MEAKFEMSQNAYVKKIVNDGVAEITLLRQMECKNCDNRDICSQKPTTEVVALASNPINAQVGDVVEVDSNAGNPIGIAVIVYVLPCVFLILGYLLGQGIGLGEGASIGLGALGILVGFLPAWILNRVVSRRKGPEFVIRTKLA